MARKSQPPKLDYGYAEGVGGGMNIPSLSRQIKDWLFEGKCCGGWSRATLESRHIYTKNLI